MPSFAKQLTTAVDKRDLRLIRTLLSDHSRVRDCITIDDLTALIKGKVASNIPMLKIFIECLRRSVDTEHVIPNIYANAIMDDDEKLVSRIHRCRVYDVDLFLENMECTALALAAGSSEKMLKCFLKLIPESDMESVLNNVDNSDETPLITAIYNTENVALLLSLKADPNIGVDIESGDSALGAACSTSEYPDDERCLQTVKLLIDAGANMHPSVFTFCIDNDMVKHLDYMIDKGFDIHSKNFNYGMKRCTPLKYAFKSEMKASVKLFLDRGARLRTSMLVKKGKMGKFVRNYQRPLWDIYNHLRITRPREKKRIYTLFGIWYTRESQHNFDMLPRELLQHISFFMIR